MILHYRTATASLPICGKWSHSSTDKRYRVNCPECIKILEETRKLIDSQRPLDDFVRYTPSVLTQQLVNLSPIVRATLADWENGRFHSWEECLIATILAQYEAINLWEKLAEHLTIHNLWAQNGMRDVANMRPPNIEGLQVLDVQQCAACGEDHQIAFRKLAEPQIKLGVIQATHWGECLFTNQPVYMKDEVANEE